MTAHRFRSSRPDKWVHPRSSMDPSLRFMKHGPILPMVEECGRAGIDVRRELIGGVVVLVLFGLIALGVAVVL